MHIQRLHAGRAATLLASFLLAGAVWASDFAPPQHSPLSPDLAPMPTLPVSSPDPGNDRPAAVAGMGRSVDPAALARLRGGSNVDNDVDLLGQVNNNSADRITSGSNTISDGAFGNASGLSTVIQNTGSNVLIQNGTVVNVQFVAPIP